MLVFPEMSLKWFLKKTYKQPIKNKFTLRFQTLISTFVFLRLSLLQQPVPMQVNW
jgi:hypothetical protein